MTSLVLKAGMYWGRDYREWGAITDPRRWKMSIDFITFLVLSCHVLAVWSPAFAILHELSLALLGFEKFTHPGPHSLHDQ